jgi:hypothetical protein
MACSIDARDGDRPRGLQALLTDSIERASPFLRSSFQMPQRSLSASQLTAHRARHFARRPGASLTLRLDADSLFTYASDSAR